MKKNLISLAVITLLLSACGADSSRSFKTDRFGIDINDRGYITGMWTLTRESRNFSPRDQPSPLLSFYDEDLSKIRT